MVIVVMVIVVMVIVVMVIVVTVASYDVISLMTSRLFRYPDASGECYPADSRAPGVQCGRGGGGGHQGEDTVQQYEAGSRLVVES